VFGLALTVFGIQSVGIAKQTDRLITRVEVLENVQMTVAVNSKTLSAIESNLAYIRDRVDKLREREEQK
jgi:ABC-type ATPase involved in cell division